MNITNNYVHDNYNNGIWLDFNNAGANISNNYIASNWGFGIDYEASYNANISDNNLEGNGWASDGSWPTSTYCSTWDSTYECANGAGPSSQYWGNLNAGGMYISSSGGNPNIAGSNYSNELLIEGNNFQNNWSSMSVYTNDQRFSGGYQYTQCDSPLQGTNATYSLQTQGFVTDGVTNATTTITSSGGFLQVCNNESTPGPAITPSAGWHVYDSAGKIPANDTIASCASAHSCTLTTPATGSTTGDYIQASPTGGCGMADLAGTAQGSSYWDNCLFGTFHVTVSSNTFAMASNSVTGCTAASRCGEVDLINYAAGFPSSVFDIYNGGALYTPCTVGPTPSWLLRLQHDAGHKSARQRVQRQHLHLDGIGRGGLVAVPGGAEQRAHHLSCRVDRERQRGSRSRRREQWALGGPCEPRRWTGHASIPPSGGR